MSELVRVENLSKTFPRGWRKQPFAALNQVSLAVAEGEVFGFVGPNGAGKSTTIKILLGISRATAGNVTLLGYPVTDPRSRRGLGYVSESPTFSDYLTPLEILRMGTEIAGKRMARRDQHCLGWLERLGLREFANTVVKGFSKGMIQRTALAHALALEPRLLILDEPLSGLDPLGRRDVVDILAEYRRQGGTIFLTSHVLHDVERLADRFGLIHKGCLSSVRSPAELVGSDDTVMVRSLGASPLPGMKEDAAGRWVAEVRRDELWTMLETLRCSGHTLVEVRPTLSLEAAFVRVVDEGAGSLQSQR
jgi:ABC-2 type transport system ATP-binding protein